jgi:hypothetical protein
VKWYIVFASVETVPIDWDRLREADVIFTFAGALRHLRPEHCKGKTLVVFLDKLFVPRSFLRSVDRINYLNADVFIDIPSNNLYEEEIRATKRLAGVIRRACLLPWAFNFARTETERSFLHFARTDPRFEGYVKGTDYLLELLDEFPNYVIGDVKVGNFLGWLSMEQHLELQAKCRLLLIPSRLDSIPRTLTAAICLDQLPVLAYTEAEFLYSLSVGFEPADYLPQFFPIARGKAEYQALVRRLMTEDDFYLCCLERLRDYKRLHPIHWDVETNYQIYKDKGLLLPRDLTPLHQRPMLAAGLLDSLPLGPWSQNELALNYV